MEVDADTMPSAESGPDIRVEVNEHREIAGEIRIRATLATVFALLTEAHGVMTWLAHYAETVARAGGVFCLADPGGLRVEGTFLEVIADRKVVLTWGGIEGLRPGQSTIVFALQADGNDTVVRLRHSGLSAAAVAAHYLGWMQWGLPKLKRVAEGKPTRGTYLADAADARERGPYLTHVVCRGSSGSKLGVTRLLRSEAELEGPSSCPRDLAQQGYEGD
jgi:uncharacterized protein YndB with AHSA1/START domain